MLNKFKGQTVKQIIQNIDEMNTELIDDAQLIKSMIEALPTSDNDEINKLKDFEEHPEKYEGNILDTSEIFSWKLYKFQYLQDKFDIMVDTLEFTPKYEDCKKDLGVILSAATQLCESKKFVRLLEIILIIGNYMNKATKKPAACGFKMSSLAKFADTKITDNKRNLVNFVCQYIHEKHADLADWQEEVQDVVPAQRVMGDDVKNKFNDLQRITKKMDTVLQKLQGKEGNQEFIGHLSSVASEYHTLFLLIENDMKKWTVKYEEACKLYSEDAKKTKSEDFFANFKSFYEAYEAAEKIYK